MNPQDPWVMGSRVPTDTPVHMLVSVDREAAAAVDRAAGLAGLERIEFLRRAIEDAVRAVLASNLQIDSAA